MAHGPVERWMEPVERWAVRGSRVEHGHVPAPERVATGLLGLGLFLLSRRDSPWRVPAAVAAGAVLARAATGVCPLYAVLDEPGRSTAQRLAGPRGQHVREHITIARPIDEVFDFWRDLATLGTATRQRISVEVVDDRRSHWTLRMHPSGEPLAEWTAELISDVPNQVLGWRTTEDADVVSAGSVNFAEAPGNQGTEVRIHLQYEPPLGRLGAAVAAVGGHAPAALIRDALRDIKRYLEIGRSVVLTP